MNWILCFYLSGGDASHLFPMSLEGFAPDTRVFGFLVLNRLFHRFRRPGSLARGHPGRRRGQGARGDRRGAHPDGHGDRPEGDPVLNDGERWVHLEVMIQKMTGGVFLDLDRNSQTPKDGKFLFSPSCSADIYLWHIRPACLAHTHQYRQEVDHLGLIKRWRGQKLYHF